METIRLGQAGPTVEFLQSILRRMGGAQGVVINGIFDGATQNAVIGFQRRSGLIADGIVGVSTWNALGPFLNGYDVHTVRSGDSIHRIAAQYGTNERRIFIANPGIDAYNLQIGQKLIIPLGSVVPTDISYSFGIMEKNIEALTVIYPFLKTGTIGCSVLGKSIPYVQIGTGAKEVLYHASFHANEWITTPVVMKFLENYARAYAENDSIFGYDAREMYQNTTIYIVPMVNPDGVDLVTGALAQESEGYHLARQIADNYPTIPFPDGWKANISGIDLNLQFPANWENAREIKFSQGFTGPAPRDYVGPTPLAAPEAYAIYRFTLAHDFRLALAYHTQGRVIFWKYLDYLPPYSYEIGQQFSNASGYALELTPYASSFAGYKDWFIQEYNRPGYTIEAGIGVNPLPISQFDTIYRENEGILVLGAVLAP